MSNFLHKFFADPFVGFLALGTIVFVVYLALGDFKERRNRRTFELRRREYETLRAEKLTDLES
jgi:hypothetical protein